MANQKRVTNGDRLSYTTVRMSVSGQQTVDFCYILYTNRPNVLKSILYAKPEIALEISVFEKLSKFGWLNGVFDLTIIAAVIFVHFTTEDQRINCMTKLMSIADLDGAES